MNAHASESNRLAAYAALSAAVAATGAASAAVQIVTLSSPVTAPAGSATRLNIGGAIFAAPGTTWFVGLREAAGTQLKVNGTTRGATRTVSILTPLLGTNAMVSNGVGSFVTGDAPFAATLFAPVSTKYVGFLARNGSAVHFGWLEFTLSGGDYTISRWAYESSAGVSISTPSAVPGGAGLAALAIGAAGLRGRRRSRG